MDRKIFIDDNGCLLKHKFRMLIFKTCIVGGKNQHRAQVYVAGQRDSKVFRTKREASAWAAVSNPLNVCPLVLVTSLPPKIPKHQAAQLGGLRRNQRAWPCDGG